MCDHEKPSNGLQGKWVCISPHEGDLIGTHVFVFRRPFVTDFITGMLQGIIAISAVAFWAILIVGMDHE